MDLDAYVQTHAPLWQRFDTLTRQRRLDGVEADELMALHEQVATHLSVIRTEAPDPQVVSYLSSLLARARIRTAGVRVPTWRTATEFVTARFPAALYRLRRWWLWTTVANLAVAALLTWWLLIHPEAEQTLMSPEQIRDLVNHEFEDYYHQDTPGEFSAKVWVNNAWVCALCLALGVLGLPVIWLLLQNIVNIALIASVMIRHGHTGHFFGLLLPHGLLELTAVFVAGGVGLRLFWSWVEPGRLTRTASLAHEGRTAATVALGLVGVLFVSGVIEGVVTPSPLPTWARVGIGVLALAGFYVYVFVVGRAAHRRGHTGDVDAALLETPVATAN